MKKLFPVTHGAPQVCVLHRLGSLWVRRSCSLLDAFVLFVALVSTSLSAAAAEIVTKSSTVPPPQDAPSIQGSIIKLDEKTLALRQQELVERQKQLEEHHRRLVIPQAPRKVQPFAIKAEAVSPTPLNFSRSAINVFFHRVLSLEETGSEVSTVAEPSIAVRKNDVLITGNWFASFSNNADSPLAKFYAINPANVFPPTESGLEFCCDQLAIYDPKADVMFWLMQYSKNQAGNLLRLAVAAKGDISANRWRYYDLVPQAIGQYKQQWFDFPACAVSRGYLYLTANMFSTLGRNPPFIRSIAMRLPLDKLASYQGFDLDYFDTKDFDDGKAFGLLPVQSTSTSDTMYLGSQVNTETLRTYTWPEGSNKITTNDVLVQVWNSAQDYQPTAPSPEGADWMTRTDDRLSAGWLSGKTVGFAWTAPRDVNFRFPHVRVTILDKDTKQVIEEPHIYSQDFAYAYLAAAPNLNGDVGVVVNFGGDKFNPSTAVGFLRKQPRGNRSSWNLATAVAGKAFPPDRAWGDYLTLRLDGRNQRNWVASTLVRENNGTTEVGYEIFGIK